MSALRATSFAHERHAVLATSSQRHRLPETIAKHTCAWKRILFVRSSSHSSVRVCSHIYQTACLQMRASARLRRPYLSNSNVKTTVLPSCVTHPSGLFAHAFSQSHHARAQQMLIPPTCPPVPAVPGELQERDHGVHGSLVRRLRLFPGHRGGRADCGRTPKRKDRQGGRHH